MPEGGDDGRPAVLGGGSALAEVAKPEPLRASGGVGRAGLHLGIGDGFRPALRPGAAGGGPGRGRERLEAAGAEVEWDKRWPGVRRFYTHDPFGNRLELLAPPTGRTDGGADTSSER